MSYVCSTCGKGRLAGHNVSHAKNRTTRSTLPNLHRVSTGRGQTAVLVCSNCLRTRALKRA